MTFPIILMYKLPERKEVFGRNKVVAEPQKNQPNTRLTGSPAPGITNRVKDKNQRNISRLRAVFLAVSLSGAAVLGGAAYVSDNINEEQIGSTVDTRALNSETSSQTESTFSEIKARLQGKNAEERYSAAMFIGISALKGEDTYENAWEGYEQDVVNALIPFIDDSGRGIQTSYVLQTFTNKNWDNLPDLWDTSIELVNNGNQKQVHFALSNIVDLGIDDKSKMPEAWEISLNALSYPDDSAVRALANTGIAMIAIKYPEKTQEGFDILSDTMSGEIDDIAVRTSAATGIAYIGANDEKYRLKSWEALSTLYRKDPTLGISYKAAGIMAAAYPDGTMAKLAWAVLADVLKSSDDYRNTSQALQGIHEIVVRNKEKARLVVESDLVRSQITFENQTYDPFQLPRTIQAMGVIASAAISHAELAEDLIPEAVKIIEQTMEKSGDAFIRQMGELYLKQIGEAETYYKELKAKEDTPANQPDIPQPK